MQDNNNNNNNSSSNLSSNHQEQIPQPDRSTTMTTVAFTQNTATFESPPLLPLLEWPTPLNNMHVNTADINNDTAHNYQSASLLFDTSDDHASDDIMHDSDILDRFLLISPDVLTTGSGSAPLPTPDLPGYNLLSFSGVTAPVTTATTTTMNDDDENDELFEEFQQNQSTIHLISGQNYGQAAHAQPQPPPPSTSFLAQLMSPSLFPMPQQAPMYEQFSITVERPVSPVAPSNNQAVNYYPSAVTPSVLSASTSASGPSGVSILDVLNKIHGPTSHHQQLANQSSSHNINEYQGNIIKDEYQNNQNSSVNSSSVSQSVHRRSSSSVGGRSTSLLVPQPSSTAIFSSSTSTSSSSSSSYSMTESTASTSTSSSSSMTSSSVASSSSSSASTSMSDLINTFNQRMQAWPGLTFNQKPWILRTRKSSKGKNKGKRKSWSGATSVSPTPSSNPLPPLSPCSPSASSSSSASSPLSAREVSFVDFYQATSASATATASSSSSAPSDVSHQVQRSSSLPSFSTLSPYSDHESSSDGTPPLLASSSNEQATRRSKRASTGQIIDYFQGAQEKRRKRQCVSVIEDNKGNQRKIYGYNWSQNTESRK